MCSRCSSQWSRWRAHDRSWRDNRNRKRDAGAEQRRQTVLAEASMTAPEGPIARGPALSFVVPSAPTPHRVGRIALHPMTWLFVCTVPIIGYNVGAYLDPRGIGGDREATFERLYLTLAIAFAVGTAFAAVAILRNQRRRARAHPEGVPDSGSPAHGA